VYYYFRTGQTDARGREILAKLPSPSDPGFGNVYASLMAGRTRRLNAKVTASAELSLKDFSEMYERSSHFARLAPGSQRLYALSLRHVRAMLPTAPARFLERKDVVRLIDGRAETPGAANSLLRTMKALYKWGRERGHVDSDPCRDVAELPIGEHDPWPDHVLAAALASGDPIVRLSVHLLYFTAQRIGDVLKMRWTDIRDGRIEFTQQKTKKAMSVRIHADLQRELDRYPVSIGYIVTGRGGRQLRQERLRQILQGFAGGLGVKIVPHGLRKNAVNALLEAGCSAAETASISGQSLQMVEHYAKARSQQRLGDSAVLKWQRHGS
jgi:integrase